MNDFDRLVRDELNALAAVPTRLPDWEDVLRRTIVARHRRLLLALAAVLVVLVCAAAVTAALGGFGAWLSGSPGRPAPASEQARFEAENGHSWAAFPTGTRLRELTNTTVEGKRYVLYGFRSGKTLCLKLEAVSLGHSVQACAPASTLAHVTAPILVVDNWTFFDRFNHPSAMVSFGIAADGVSRIDVHATDGTHRAVVGGNAYLFVEDRPNTADMIEAVSAIGANGRRATISFHPVYGGAFSGFAAAAKPRGPAHVQATIPHPRIGWLARGEKRGYSPSGQPDLHLVKPDPLSDLVVGFQGPYCLVTAIGPPVPGGVGCSDARHFFALGPLNIMLAQQGNTQFVEVAGAAADGVARVELFLADGERESAPLVDNVFAAFVPSSAFPARVVAYNRRGLVVATQTFRDSLRGAPGDILAGLRPIGQVRGPEGATATIEMGPTRGFRRCWRLSFSTGQRPTGCLETIATGPWTDVELVQPAGRDVFVAGTTRPPVARVQLRFTDGDVISTGPVKRLFVFAIPRRHLSAQRQLAFVVGVEENGTPVQRQGVLFRANK